MCIRRRMIAWDDDLTLFSEQYSNDRISKKDIECTKVMTQLALSNCLCKENQEANIH